MCVACIVGSGERKNSEEESKMYEEKQQTYYS